VSVGAGWVRGHVGRGGGQVSWGVRREEGGGRKEEWKGQWRGGGRRGGGRRGREGKGEEKCGRMGEGEGCEGDGKWEGWEVIN